jgi:hypothetical protein
LALSKAHNNKRQKQNKAQPKKFTENVLKNRILIISVTACILVILLAVILARAGFFNMVSGLFVPNGEVRVGTIPISDGLDDVKEIPEGEIRFRLNKTVTFTDGYAQGDIMLENPEASSYDMDFTFYTMDSMLIYASPTIKPGEYIFKDKLKKKLKKGEYECVYKVVAYDSNGIRAGETGGFLTITVEN